jgi:uridine kinase
MHGKEVIQISNSTCDNRPFIVGIGGPSCSGKGAVIDQIAGRNQHVMRICQDSFFRINSPVQTRGYTDIDDPRALMMDEFARVISSLREGHGARLPSRGWTEDFNVEITDAEVSLRPLVIVEGFLLYVTDELADLFDARIFIDVSDLNILYRRLKRENHLFGLDYTYDIVIPNARRDSPRQRKAADKLIDGDQSISEVTTQVIEYLSSGILPSRLRVDMEKEPWPVSFGTLLTDNGWHPLKDGDLKDWCKTGESQALLQTGDELKGNTFTYRHGALGAGRYEVRLNGWCNLFTYSNQPTRELGKY